MAKPKPTACQLASLDKDLHIHPCGVSPRHSYQVASRPDTRNCLRSVLLLLSPPENTTSGSIKRHDLSLSGISRRMCLEMFPQLCDPIRLDAIPIRLEAIALEGRPLPMTHFGLLWSFRFASFASLLALR